MDDCLETLPSLFEETFTLEPSLSSRLAFPLFALPPELWLRIAYFSILRPNPIDITLAPTPLKQQKIVRQPAITRACRLLRQETLPLFYKCNDFRAQHLAKVPCIRHWFPAIGEASLKCMAQFIFDAQFEAGFWEGQFRGMGMKVKVRAAETEEGRVVVGGRRGERRLFQRLVVEFGEVEVGLEVAEKEVEDASEESDLLTYQPEDGTEVYELDDSDMLQYQSEDENEEWEPTDIDLLGLEEELDEDEREARDLREIEFLGLEEEGEGDVTAAVDP